MLSFKPAFSLSSFTFIKRLFSRSSLSVIRVVSSAYLKVKVKSLSRVLLFAIPWTVVYQAPPSMRSSRQEHCSGLPFPSAEDLPDPGIEPRSPTLQTDVLPSESPGNSCLLISWLQLPTAVILEPKKTKSVTASTFSLPICHEVMGPDAKIFVFLNVEFQASLFTLLFNLHQEAL